MRAPHASAPSSPRFVRRGRSNVTNESVEIVARGHVEVLPGEPRPANRWALRWAQLGGVVIKTALEHDFTLTFNYFEGELPRGANGKFEEFVSKLDAA